MERCWKAAMVAPTGCAALGGADLTSAGTEPLGTKLSVDAAVIRGAAKRTSCTFAMVDSYRSQYKAHAGLTDGIGVGESPPAGAEQVGTLDATVVRKARKKRKVLNGSRMTAPWLDEDEVWLLLRRKPRARKRITYE